MLDERKQAIRELVSEWMRYAYADLNVVKLVDDERLAPDIIAFHAQQAAEKALKALLVHRQIEFPVHTTLDFLPTYARLTKVCQMNC